MAGTKNSNKSLYTKDIYVRFNVIITNPCEITVGHLSRAEEALDFAPRLLISLACS